MLLALDDTDGPDGGCTTHVAHRILQALEPSPPSDPAPGLPRLVRLFPANPWKTRGNAAVALHLPEHTDPARALDTAFRVVAEHARLADGKGAGVALFETPPPEAWYHRGVQGPLELAQAREALEALAWGTRTLGTGRGLVGCLAAAAWRPGPAATYERILYREPARWGTRRAIHEARVRDLAETHPSTYDSWDPHQGHAVLAPRTPCPVLLGVRATDPSGLDTLAPTLAGEPVAGARTFVSNQASDDHLRAEALEPLTVTHAPEALPGGHVRFRGKTSHGQARACMAFEPTGRLRHAVLQVREGDRVVPCGDLRDGQVHLEKMLHLPAGRRVRQPCPCCGRAMASAGHQAGVRCKRCGTRAPKRYERAASRWYEATPSARRHLARPLRLGLAPRIADTLASHGIDAPVPAPARGRCGASPTQSR